MGTIRGVLFDAGNTLIRVRGSVGCVYASVARRHGVETDGESLDRHFRQAFSKRKEGFVPSVSNPHSPAREKAWWHGLVREVFEAAGLWSQIAPAFEAYFEELYRAFEGPEHWEVFSDVLPCLHALERRNVRLGVVSNWDSRLHSVLDGLGLGPHFRFVLTSAEFGVEKPEPTIFVEAVRRLGLPAPHVLHVGDLYRDDVMGPRAAGLQGVLLDREKRGCPGSPCVGDLVSLVTLVDNGLRTVPDEGSGQGKSR